MGSGIVDIFDKRVKNIGSIFSSYRELHTMYTQILTTANVNSNALTAFERSKDSAATKQSQISTRLYAQGFILLTGTAEALLKDVFEDLLVKNFATISGASGLNFTTKELQDAIVAYTDSVEPLEDVSAALGRLTINKIFKSQNPAEKINFQNTMTMKSVFQQYFGITLPESEGLNSIHRYWQVRHCLVHNDSTIDTRFIHNVRKVDLLKTTETEGSKITVRKRDFDQATTDFRALFRDLEVLIAQQGLSTKFAIN